MKMCARYLCSNEGIRATEVKSDIGYLNIFLCTHHFTKYCEQYGIEPRR